MRHPCAGRRLRWRLVLLGAVAVVAMMMAAVWVPGCSEPEGDEPTTTSLLGPPAPGQPQGVGAQVTSSKVGAIEAPGYVAAMQDWINTYLFGMDTSALAIDDAATATPEQITAADKAAGEVRSALVTLRAIQPPALMKEIHAEFVASVAQLADAVDKYVAAVRKGNEAVAAVMPTFAAAQARLQAAVQMLAPDVGVTIPQSGG